ncbi:MAG: dihydroxyacetone kinase subunit L [Scytonematopsis contorta HA4267-MV1]|nr:dihydroxyacetone kinase subunit L [Scytonematopsis contorta HA4267-MV1]
MVTKQHIFQWLHRYTLMLEQNKDYLTDLDAAIGDADHGLNMDRGFKKVMKQLPQVSDQDIGGILKAVSMTLISSVGGASGPLYGSWFLRASSVVSGKQELDEEDMLHLMEAGLDGVIGRGKAQLGDKTMVDVLNPAVDAFGRAVVSGKDMLEAMEQAVNAAEQAMKDTKSMQAKKGRASYLGDRSLGHQDPGATSCYFMLKSLFKTLSCPDD